MTDALKTSEKSIIHFNDIENNPSMGNVDDLKNIYNTYMFADAVHDFSSERSRGSDRRGNALDVRSYFTEFSDIAPSNIEHKLEEAFCRGKLLTQRYKLSSKSVATLSSLCQPEYEVEYDMDKDNVMDRINSSYNDYVLYAHKLYKGDKKYFSKRVRENISKIINRFDKFSDSALYLGKYSMINKLNLMQSIEVSLKDAHMLLIDAQSITTDDFFYNSTTMEWENIVKISEEANKYDTASTSMPNYLSKVCDSSTVVNVDRNISNLHRVWDGVSRNDEVVVNTISCSLSPIIVDLRNTYYEFKKIFTENYAYTLVDLTVKLYGESLIEELNNKYMYHRLPMLFSPYVYFYVVRILTRNLSDSECNGYVMLYNERSHKACIILAKGYRVSDDFGVDKIAQVINNSRSIRSDISNSCIEIITYLTDIPPTHDVFALFMLDIKRTGDMSQVMSIKLNRDINAGVGRERVRDADKNVGGNMILMSNDRNAILFSRMLNIPSIRTSNIRLKDNVSSTTDSRPVKKKDDKIIVLYLHTPVVHIKDINEYIRTYKNKINILKQKITTDSRYHSYFTDYGDYIYRLWYVIQNIQFEESRANYLPDTDRTYMNNDRRVVNLCKTLNRIFLFINMFYCGLGLRNFNVLKGMKRDDDANPLFTDDANLPSTDDEKQALKDIITQRYAEYVKTESIMNDVFSYTHTEAITRRPHTVSGFVKSLTNLKKNFFLIQNDVFEEKPRKIIECVSKIYDTCLLFKSQSFDMPKAFSEMITILNTFVHTSIRRDKPTREKFSEIMRTICSIVHTITKYYPESSNLSEICFISVNDVREYKLKFEGDRIDRLYTSLEGFLKNIEGELMKIIITFNYSEIQQIIQQIIQDVNTSVYRPISQNPTRMVRGGRSSSISRRRFSVKRARSRIASRNSKPERSPSYRRRIRKTRIQPGGHYLRQHRIRTDVNYKEEIGNAFYTLLIDDSGSAIKEKFFSHYDGEENEYVSYDDEDFHIFNKDFKKKIHDEIQDMMIVSKEYIGDCILNRLFEYCMPDDIVSSIHPELTSPLSEERIEDLKDIQRKCELLHDYMSIRFRYDDDSNSEKLELMRKLGVDRDTDVNSTVINYFHRIYIYANTQLLYYKNVLREAFDDMTNRWHIVKNIYYTLKGLHDMIDYLGDIEIIYGSEILEDYEYVDMCKQIYLVSEMYEYYVGRFINNTNAKLYDSLKKTSAKKSSKRLHTRGSSFPKGFASSVSKRSSKRIERRSSRKTNKKHSYSGWTGKRN
jgi:hypothetical protein